MPQKPIPRATIKSLWAISIEKIYPYFKQDDDNDGVVKLLQLYAAKDPRFETMVPGKNYSLDKGLLLYGDVGTGKTMIMRILQQTLFLIQSKQIFTRYNMRELCQKYQVKGAERLQPERRHWFVDELGLGAREEVISYGNKLRVGDELIATRYDLFHEGYITHFTTNLRPTDMDDFYDRRNVNRLKEMCNFIPLNGPERRTTAKPAPRPQEQDRTVDRKTQELLNWESLRNRYEDYKAGKELHISRPLAQIKDFENAGLLVMPTDKKNEAVEEAKARLVARFNSMDNKFRVFNREAYSDAKKLADAIQAGKLTEAQDTSIKCLAVCIAIKYFYDTESPDAIRGKFEIIINNLKSKL